jgi:hypothetical protein
VQTKTTVEEATRCVKMTSENNAQVVYIRIHIEVVCKLNGDNTTRRKKEFYLNPEEVGICTRQSLMPIEGVSIYVTTN